MTLDKLTIVLRCFFLLLKSVEPSFSAFYCTDVNLLFLQPILYLLRGLFITLFGVKGLLYFL